MEPITAAEEKQIVNSIKRVFAKNDIEALTKKAYNFIYLASGFIAHYDIYGFRGVYANPKDLARELIQNKEINKWENFHPGERDYEYYMSKARVYKELVKLARSSC